MSADLAGELDDAAFRERLAPLAAAVLPGTARAAAVPQAAGISDAGTSAPRNPRRAMAMWVASAAVLAGAAFLLATSHRDTSRGPPAAAATVQPSPAPVPLSSRRSETAYDAPLVTVLLARGDAAAANGDITAARLLYERAADAGSAKAASELADSYEVPRLLALGARATNADPSRAAYWRRRATALAEPASPGAPR